MRNAYLRLGVFAAALFTAGLAGAQERVERTGSRLGADGTTRTVIQFGEPSEIRRILALLDQGKTDDALALAEDYVESLDGTVQANSNIASERYYALNALCAARTKAGKLEDAIAACSEAIMIFPLRWMAINSRGTAYFALHQFDKALADYRRALAAAPKSDNAIATIEHNIRLAEARLAAEARNGG